jgi:hypothetical protein
LSTNLDIFAARATVVLPVNLTDANDATDNLPAARRAHARLFRYGTTGYEADRGAGSRDGDRQTRALTREWTAR